MATITHTVEETLTFTAKPSQKLKKLQRQQSLDSYEGQKLGPLLLENEGLEKHKPELSLAECEELGVPMCPPDCQDCKRMKSQLCPPGCEECKVSQPCPPNCLTCKKQRFQAVPLLFNAVGIIIAVLATYMIVSTDSYVYLVFWVFYSVLRRMMSKSKPRMKTE